MPCGTSDFSPLTRKYFNSAGKYSKTVSDSSNSMKENSKTVFQSKTSTRENSGTVSDSSNPARKYSETVFQRENSSFRSENSTSLSYFPTGLSISCSPALHPDRSSSFPPRPDTQSDRFTRFSRTARMRRLTGKTFLRQSVGRRGLSSHERRNPTFRTKREEE